MKPNDSFIQQPIRSLQTMLRIISEDGDSIPTVVPDGIYGQQTIRAVSAFQNQYGLPVTGVTNQETWEAIVRAYESAEIRVNKAEPIEIIMDPGQVFRRGDRSPYVLLLQSILIYLSQDAPAIPRPEHNGILDAKTADALRAFQGISDLPVTGELDKITWKHLSKQFTLNAHHNKFLTDMTKV